VTSRGRGIVRCVSDPVRTILVATDSDEVLADVEAALSEPGTTLARVRRGSDVVAAVDELAPDLVVLDLQIGNMGGIATCLALRNEASFGRVDEQQIVVLLDRVADVFLARRSGADGWLVKPLDPLRLRRAARSVIDGGRFTDGHDDQILAPQPGAVTASGISSGL
jgi:DNA-binding response OmpR family regulator